MPSRRLPVLALSLLLFFPAYTEAQEQGGAIEGVVTDASGARVPGATLRVTSAAGLTLETVSGPSGDFRFPALGPGHYDLVATLSGFQPAAARDIVLSLGQVLRVALRLEVGGVSEEVVITAASPLIDVKQSASFVNVRDVLIDKIPKGRDFSSLVVLAPGARDEPRLGGISIDGASGSENRFVVDGLDTTGLVFGLPAKMPITDFVEEVQVKSSGYAAEFAARPGGGVNVVTRSATNEWRGSAVAYFSSDRLNGPARPFLRINPTNDKLAEYVTWPKDSFSTWEPGGSFGGPIRRNRALTIRRIRRGTGSCS